MRTHACVGIYMFKFKDTHTHTHFIPIYNTRPICFCCKSVPLLLSVAAWTVIGWVGVGVGPPVQCLLQKHRGGSIRVMAKERPSISIRHGKGGGGVLA